MSDQTKSSFHCDILQARAVFSDLVQRAMLGQEVIITKDQKPLLALVALNPSQPFRRPGSANDGIWIADDFDEMPDDFNSYV